MSDVYWATMGIVNKLTGSFKTLLDVCGMVRLMLLAACAASLPAPFISAELPPSIMSRNHPTCFVGSVTPQFTRFVLSKRMWSRTLPDFLRVASSTIVISPCMRTSNASHELCPQAYNFVNCSGVRSGKSASNRLPVAIFMKNRFGITDRWKGKWDFACFVRC